MRAVNINKITMLTVFLFLSTGIYAQNFASFKKLTPPEKKWVIFHPFIAKKVYTISIKAKNISDSLAVDTIFDGDKNGGQIDAFRHTLWMAMLTQEYNWRKIYKLGVAHEKGNYYQFKHSLPEDNSIPDKISSDMDLLNNDAGRQIGLDNKKANTNELIEIIKNELLNGNLWIIKKNAKGQFLDQYGNVINNKELKGKWENNKVLVKSNYDKRKH